MDLLSQNSGPLPKGTKPLKGDDLAPFTSEISKKWKVVDEHHLEARFEFSDFMGALTFANQVGGAAEAEGHHPEITVGWGEAVVRIWTHSIDGLSVNDFILAAKLDKLD